MLSRAEGTLWLDVDSGFGGCSFHRMKKVAVVFLVSSALVLSIVLPGEAHGGRGHIRSRVFIGVGPALWWGWGPYPYWYYPPPYYVYPTPDYVYPTPVVAQEPSTYIQQSAPAAPAPPSPVAAPPAPPAPPAPESYWYYCPSARNYYPMVQTCPEPWVKVPPRQ